MTTGVYVIRNSANKQSYIGSAVKIEQRWHLHRFHLKNGSHSRHLQKSWDKYGSGKFSFEILEIVSNPKSLKEREQYWIDKLQPKLNVHLNARSPLGVKRSEETKAKMRAIKKPWMAERNRTLKMRAISRANAIARNKTPEQKAAVSAARTGTHFNHTPEAIEKIRAAKLGKKPYNIKHGPNGQFIRL